MMIEINLVIIPIVAYLWWQGYVLFVLAKGLFQKKEARAAKYVTDEKLLNLIYSKTGLKLDKIKLSNTPQYIGAMINVVGRPRMVLSRKLYEDFSPRALEYVVLHEAGHAVKNHSKRLAAVFALFYLVSAVFLVFLLDSTFFALILGTIVGQLVILYGRKCEYEADHYAINRVSDPRGMIEATQLLASQQKNPNAWWKRFVAVGVPHPERIRIAKEEIKARKMR